ncbi:hypothetical protein CEK25_004167 [Fusarium fujikuroi]|nr:hypothetical protein CEK25_004167 [Fusarium fujikuroi]
MRPQLRLNERGDRDLLASNAIVYTNIVAPIQRHLSEYAGPYATENNFFYAAYASICRTLRTLESRSVPYSPDVRAAYGPVSWLYLIGDVSYEGYKYTISDVLNEGYNSSSHNQRRLLAFLPLTPDQEPGTGLPATARRLIALGPARNLPECCTVMGLPAFFHSVVSMGLAAFAMKSVMKNSGQVIRTWKLQFIRSGPPVVPFLPAIPFRRAMFENAVEWAFHKGFETGGKAAVGNAAYDGSPRTAGQDLLAKRRKYNFAPQTWRSGRWKALNSCFNVSINI